MSSAGLISKRSLGEQVRWLAYAALDLLFPPRCVSCKRLETNLCDDCIAAFEVVVGPVCKLCGRPIGADGYCDGCAQDRSLVASIRSAYYFTGPARDAVHAFKYRYQRALALPLARSISTVLQHPGSDWALCPVPLHQARQAARGYNQSELLAQHLADLWNLPQLLPSSLVRSRDTAQQMKLDRSQRQQNVSGAFIADRVLVEGGAILLVDDVCTTGATLFACAQALVDAGAQKVEAVTFARAPQSPRVVR
jgi:ComF family protein